MHKYDRDLVVDMLDNMLWALGQIQKRFAEIDDASDFLDSDMGLLRTITSILMQKQYLLSVVSIFRN